MENRNETTGSGKTLLLATLLLAAISLSACVVAPDRDGHGRHHHWNNDRNWNNGPGWKSGSGWQGRHGDWDGQH
ncbi:hypothetical protein [Dongia sp.]|uniref:hypothetical protein n=1 Tax=Dongia sp. TaxID=1977262 RepID=UPI00375100E8